MKRTRSSDAVSEKVGRVQRDIALDNHFNQIARADDGHDFAQLSTREPQHIPNLRLSFRDYCTHSRRCWSVFDVFTQICRISTISVLVSAFWSASSVAITL